MTSGLFGLIQLGCDMTKVTFLFFLAFSFSSLIVGAQTCRKSLNETVASTFICSVHATVLYDGGCDVQVKERLLYPFSTGERFVRLFQLPQHRVLSDFTAVNGNRTMKLTDNLQGRFNISMKSNRVSTPVLLQLSYRLRNGLDRKCTTKGGQLGNAVLAWHSQRWNRTIDFLSVRLASTAPGSNISLIKMPAVKVIRDSSREAIVETRSVNTSVSVKAVIDATCRATSGCSKRRRTRRSNFVLWIILGAVGFLVLLTCCCPGNGSSSGSGGAVGGGYGAGGGGCGGGGGC